MSPWGFGRIRAHPIVGEPERGGRVLPDPVGPRDDPFPVLLQGRTCADDRLLHFGGRLLARITPNEAPRASTGRETMLWTAGAEKPPSSAAAAGRIAVTRRCP